MRRTCSVVGPSDSSWPVVGCDGFCPNIRPIADNGEFPSWAEAAEIQRPAAKAAVVSPRIIRLVMAGMSIVRRLFSIVGRSGPKCDWLRRLKKQTGAFGAPVLYPDRAGLAYEVAPRTVTARRFCDQHEMS